MKICVPVTGADLNEINGQLKELEDKDFDMIEWRADYFFSMEALESIRHRFPDKELIFTFRTKKEGGQSQPETGYLAYLYNLVAISGLVDIMDLEMEGICVSHPEIIKKMKAFGIRLMLSNHDFERTPEKRELIDRWNRMEKLGADIGKIAVMPQSPEDVQELMAAALEVKQMSNMPIVAISMGELGKDTRVKGEKFGSMITFASLEKASAPGQIPVDQMRKLLQEA